MNTFYLIGSKCRLSISLLAIATGFETAKKIYTYLKTAKKKYIYIYLEYFKPFFGIFGESNTPFWIFLF